MKKRNIYLIIPILCLFSIHTYSQQVAINEDGSAPNVNAILDVKSFTRGVLFPRMSTTSRLAIPATKGLLVYDTTAGTFFFNTGSSWQSLSTGGAADAGWLLSGNSTVSNSNFLGTINNAPLRIRVNNQPSGLIDFNFGNAFWGYNSGAATSSGEHNVANGIYSLNHNTGGSYNTAVGGYSLFANTTGNNNTVVGYNSTPSNTDGQYNTALANRSLFNNITGWGNTAIGSVALYTNISGHFITALGYGADIRYPNAGFNATAIGYNALAYGLNDVRVGNSAINLIEGAVPWYTTSDGRFKFDVQEDVKGLDFILQLRPVTYRFDGKRFDEQQNKNSDSLSGMISEKMQSAYEEAASIRRSGFIAQDAEKAAIASGYNFNGIRKPKTEQEHYSISYESFVVPLVKAVQEQQMIIADLQKQLAEIRQRLLTLK